MSSFNLLFKSINYGGEGVEYENEEKWKFNLDYNRNEQHTHTRRRFELRHHITRWIGGHKCMSFCENLTEKRTMAWLMMNTLKCRRGLLLWLLRYIVTCVVVLWNVCWFLNIFFYVASRIFVFICMTWWTFENANNTM